MTGAYILVVIVALLIWILGYIISFLFFGNRVLLNNMPKFFDKFSRKQINYSMVLLPFVFALISGLTFRLGGVLEKRNDIFWGCYIEDYSIFSILLWILSVVVLFFILIIILFFPKSFGVRGIKNAFYIYVLHHLYMLVFSVLIIKLIPILASSLRGVNSTCW
jgi:hypothetical protein